MSGDEVTIETLGTKDQYETAIKGALRVAIDFTASWCPPCKRIGPVFARMSKEYPNIKFYKIDVDENADVAQLEDISAMPTFKFYYDGTCVESVTGANEVVLRAQVAALAGR